MYESKKQNGITLIALIITIIILLILAGVTINVLIGDNGLFNTAKKAGEEYIKSQLKEELEIEIANIQSKKIANGEELSREDLWELEKIGAIMISVETPAEGEYKDYNFTVDENYVVTIGEKNNAIKPKIELTKATEEIVEEVTIKVKVTTEDGTIVSVTKPDGTTTEETEFEYKVKENKIYRFTAKGSNGAKAIESIEITNVKEIVAEPIIQSNYGYPVLKSTGISVDNTISIIFDNKEGLENYYSIDNGLTWTKYTGPFKLDNPVEVIAKSVKNNIILAQSNKNIVLSTDGLGSIAFDGDETTRVSGGNYYIAVDSSAIGKKVRILMKSTEINYGHGDCFLVFEDGNEEKIVHVENKEKTDVDITIPENVVKLKFDIQQNAGIYEIQLVEALRPIIESNNGYPVLKSTGTSVDNIVSITYDNKEGLENYYSIDKGITWTKYIEPFKLNNPVEVRAKSVKDEVILSQSSKEIILATDGLGSAAFDGDETTRVSGGNYYIAVDTSAIGKKVRILMKSTAIDYSHGRCAFIFEDGTDEEIAYVSNKSSFDSIITIPENVVKLEFWVQSNAGIYEIQLVD